VAPRLRCLAVVIYRRDTISDQPHRRPLGHVMLTIDDLHSLMELLKARPDVTGDIVVEYDEGHFTEAKDLRELTGQSLRSLRVTAAGLVVELSDRQAEAIGPEPLVTFVDRAWAQRRQTKKYPSGVRWFDRYNPWLAAVPGVGMGVLFLVALGPELVRTDREWGLALLVGIAALLAYIGAKSNLAGHALHPYAVIIARTADEVREAERERNLVPLWALIVTGTIGAASILINVLNYLKP
jgi:hypothetical protein